MDALPAIAQAPLDEASELPLYRQLYQRITQFIASGSLDATTPLPTEKQLCEAFGLSRATVRRCFQDLVDEGRVVRRRGQGTFVSPGAGAASALGHGDTLSFSAEMRKAGRTPSSRVLGLRRRQATKGISRRLDIPDGTPVWEVRRLRLADDQPMQLAVAYVPEELCPELTKADLESSLYALIAEKSDRLPGRAEETYEAVCLDASEAKALGVRPGTAAMRVLRTTYDTSGRPFEASVLIAPGDRDRLVVSLSPTGTELRRVWG